LLISDLVNSLIKVNKGEEEKERLQKEITSLTKNLQRAKQSQGYASVVALFQQQLDAAKDELANHVKSITQHRSLSNQAQDNFNWTLSQLKPQPQPQLEKILERVASLESTMNGMRQGRHPTPGDNPIHGNAKNETVQKDMQGRDQDIATIKETLDRVQHTVENPSGLEEALGYMKKIANSVAYQSKKSGQFTKQISQLEDEVKDVDKKLNDKVSAIKRMVDTVEEEMKNFNDQLETNISDLGCKLKTTNEQVAVKLSSLESDLTSLNTKRPDLENRASTQVSQIETDLEAQRKQTTEQITAQENLVASLRTQHQNADNGGRLSSEVTPIPNGGVVPRLTFLEKKVQSHADLLNIIKTLHQEVDLLRLSELESLRKNQESSQTKLETRYNDISQKVDDLVTKFEETTKNQTKFASSLQEFRSSLPATLDLFRTQLQSGLDGVEVRFALVSELSRALKKCVENVDTHATGIRSLESRYNNLMTGDLVDRMACAMQTMYPSVDQLSRQLTTHRTEIEARISALKKEADAFKADTELFKADTNQFKADTAKAQADAQNAQASTEALQAAQVSLEQLQTLTQLPTLLQQVKDLSDKLVPIESLIHEHSAELQKNLELRSELHNRITAQEDTIAGIAQKADDQDEELQTVSEAKGRIDPLIEEVKTQTSQVQELRRMINELAEAAAESNSIASTDLNDLRRRLGGLEDRKKADDESLDILRKTLKNLQGQNKADDAGLDSLWKEIEDLKDRNTADDAGLDALRKQIQVLQDQNKADDAGLDSLWKEIEDLKDRNTADGAGLDALRKQLQELKAQNPSEDNDLAQLRDKLEALEIQKPPVSLKDFNELKDEVKMYIKRLRTAEDTFKALGKAAKNSGAKEDIDSDDKEATDSDTLDKPMEQRIDGHGRALTPRAPATAKSFPKGPSLGVYQPVPPSGKGPDTSLFSASKLKRPPTQARPFVQTPSGPSSSHQSPYAGKSAEPRQIQNLKGKRRMSSVTDSDDERNITESSVVESSPVSSSSGPAYFNQGASRKEKKKAKKRAEQAEKNSNASSRPNKKRKQTKQDE
jgi:chromosome segregation ATPase